MFLSGIGISVGSHWIRCMLDSPQDLVETLRVVQPKLGGGFTYFFFHPYLGKILILTNIFFRWFETTIQKNVEPQMPLVFSLKLHNWDLFKVIFSLILS